jgi:hypothetical protein
MIASSAPARQSGKGLHGTFTFANGSGAQPLCSDWMAAGFAIGASRVALSWLSSAFAHREPYQRSRRNEPDMLGRAMRMLTSRDKKSRSMEQPIAVDDMGP